MILVTYGGEAGEAFDLEDAVPGAIKEATVKGCEMVLRGRVSIGAISRSINDEASYGRATKHVIKNLMVSSYKKHEQQLFYGQAGLGDVESVDDTTGEVVISIASWAPGIFAGGEGMRLEFYNVTDDNSDFNKAQITKVDIENHKLFVTAMTGATGSIAALKLSVDAGDSIKIYEYGARGKECLGLEAMLSEQSANIFGISTANYSLWRGNTYGVAGALSFAKISKGIAQAVAKGLEGKLELYVNPKTWSDLLNEQTANRMVDSSYDKKKYEDGSESIVFYSQNGMIEVFSSTYVKEGIAFGLNIDSFERVGSSELTFKIPGSQEDFMIKLENAHGLEYRTYCDLALFCNAIGHNILYTGIVNS